MRGSFLNTFLKSKKILLVLLSITIYLFTALPIPTQAYAEEAKEDAEQKVFFAWASSSLKSSHFEQILSSANCNKNELLANACFLALKNAIYMSSKGKQTLRVIEFPREEYHGTTIFALGSFEVVNIIEDKLPKITSAKESFESFFKNRNKEEQFKQTFSQLFLPFDEVRKYFEQNTKPQELKAYMAVAINTYMKNSSDSHFEIMLSTDFDDLASGKRDEVVGIGALLHSIEGAIAIQRIYQNSPAKVAGLKNGDIISKVGEIDVTGKEIGEVVSLIKGEENSQVIITVNRDGNILQFPVLRKKFEFKNIMTEIETSKSGDQILYISIQDFMQVGLCSEFTQTVQSHLLGANIKNIVVDLRNNGGGLLNEVLCMAGAFAKEDSQLLGIWGVRSRSFEQAIIYKSGQLLAGSTPDTATKVTHTYDSTTPHLSDLMRDRKLVVLTNGASASASEVFSGIVQDLELGAVVGSLTFGKGCVQSIIPQSTTLTVKLTTSRFHLPSGRSNQKIGITPDLEIFANETDTQVEKYRLREKDLAPISPEAVPFNKPINLSAKEALSKCEGLKNIESIKSQDKQLAAAIEAAACL